MQRRLLWLLPRVMVLVVSLLFIFLVLEFATRRFVIHSSSLVFTAMHQAWLEKYWQPVNSLGYRDVEWTEETLEGKTRIIVTGDSFPSGLGVDDFHDTFPQVLQSELGDDYAVMLVAEPGWGPDDEMSDLLDYPYSADALVLSYYINDIVPACRRSTQIYTAEIMQQLTPPSYLELLVDKSYLANYLYWNVYARTQMTDQFARQGEAIEKCYNDETAWAAHTQDLQAIYNWTLLNEMPLVVVLFPDMANPPRYQEEILKVQDFFEKRGVTVINRTEDWKSYSAEERIVSALDTHPSLKIHREVGEELAALDILQNPQNAEYEIGLDTLMPPATYESYQTYQADFDLIDPEAVVLFPATGDPVVTLFSDLGKLILDTGDQPEDAFALLRIWELASATELTPEQSAAVEAWRQDKNPESLSAVGVDYLLISSSWESWLLDEEHAILDNPDNYTVVKEWDFASTQDSYKLLEVAR